MKFLYFFISLFLVSDVAVFAQKKTQALFFQPMFGGSSLSDGCFKLNNTDSIKIETLKFYISSIELLNNDAVVWKEDNSFHLIDISNAPTLQISLKNFPNIFFNKIKFNLGIDSITNVSGAMGGDLDPTKGMYWTWQSGYINFKMEGKSNLCETRNNEFQFHLGGYEYPFENKQTIILNAEKKELLQIDVDIKKLMTKIDLSTLNHVMSPCSEAVMLSEKISKIFITHQQ